MKRIRTYLLSLAVAAGMGVSVPARADMFGAGESALLAQQIFQSMQDFGLATGGVLGNGTSTFGVVYEMLDQVYEKAGQVYDMASTAAGFTTALDPELFADPKNKKAYDKASKGLQNYNSAVANTSDFGRSISAITRNFVGTSRTLTSYIEYLSQFGDDLALERASSIYRQFSSNSASVIYSIGNSILALSRIKGITPLEFKEEQRKLLEEVEGKMSGFARSAQASIQEEVLEQVRKERAKQRNLAMQIRYY